MESGVGDRQALRKVRLTKAVQHRSPQRRHANPGDQLVRIISDQVALDSSVADGAILTRAHREVHDAGQPVGHLQSVDQSSRERRERPFWMLAGHRADQMHRTGPLRKRLEVRGPRIVAPRNLDRLSGDAARESERASARPPANANLASASAVSKSRSAASQPRLPILDPPLWTHRSREAANKSQTRDVIAI